MHLGEELHNKAGDSYNDNGGGVHAICYFLRKNMYTLCMTRRVTNFVKARRSRQKVLTRTFAVRVNKGDPSTLHMFVVNLMD